MMSGVDARSPPSGLGKAIFLHPTNWVDIWSRGVLILRYFESGPPEQTGTLPSILAPRRYHHLIDAVDTCSDSMCIHLWYWHRGDQKASEVGGANIYVSWVCVLKLTNSRKIYDYYRKLREPVLCGGTYPILWCQPSHTGFSENKLLVKRSVIIVSACHDSPQTRKRRGASIALVGQLDIAEER